MAQMPGSLSKLLVDVPVAVYRGHIDRVFLFDRDEVDPVEIESAEKWYRSKLGPHEAIRFPGSNSFTSRRMEFSFAIWSAGDPECCPTEGRVTGTYKLVQQASAGAGMVVPIYGPGGAIVGLKSRPVRLSPSITMWKLVPDTAHREPVAASSSSRPRPD